MVAAVRAPRTARDVRPDTYSDAKVERLLWQLAALHENGEAPSRRSLEREELGIGVVTNAPGSMPPAFIDLMDLEYAIAHTLDGFEAEVIHYWYFLGVGLRQGYRYDDTDNTEWQRAQRDDGDSAVDAHYAVHAARFKDGWWGRRVSPADVLAARNRAIWRIRHQLNTGEPQPIPLDWATEAERRRAVLAAMPPEPDRARMVLMWAEGAALFAIARATGKNRNWVRRVIRDYRRRVLDEILSSDISCA